MSDDASSRKSEDVTFRRVKLMCSYGGKILPRPHDNQLRYVGGETHILIVPRSISFGDLMSKFSKLYGGPVVPKYQLPEDELDVLVSILGNEDLAIMMEEYDKLYSRNGTSARIRIFLFPPKQQDFLEPIDFTKNSQQEFVDAVNGLSFVSKRHGYPFTYSQGFDFLFGLDALAKQGGKSTDRALKSSTLHSTSPAFPVSVSGQEFTYPLHSVDFSQQIAAVPRQEDTYEKRMNDVFPKTKPVASTSVITMQTEYSSDNDQTNSRTYSPLVEPSRDPLSKGMIVKQHDDSLPGSLDSPVFRYSGDDLSDFSDLSLEEMYERSLILHSHSREYLRSPGKEGTATVFSKNVRDHVEAPMDLINGPKVSFGLRGRSSSDGWLNLLDSNADVTAEHRHSGTESVPAFNDYHNVDMSSGGQWIFDSTGKKAIRQGREADSLLSSSYGRQMQPRRFPNNHMSGPSYWLADDDQQHYRDGADALPHNLVFLPRPGSTQSSAPSSMPRVASAPNVMKLSGDALPPRYVAAPHTTQGPRQYDKQVPAPRYVPSSARAAHRSPSRLRDSSPVGFREQA